MTAGRQGWTMRRVCSIAVCVAMLGAPACSDDDESPTAPGTTGIAGEYQLALRASSTCETDLDAGRTQEFDATITQSGTDVTVTLVSRQGLPTQGRFEGVLDHSTMNVEGTVGVTPAEGARDYEATGTIVGNVGVDLINGLFQGTIRYGDATCAALDHAAGFVRD